MIGKLCLIVALTAVVTANALSETDYQAIDGLLFKPFCDRQSVKSILEVCAPPAVEETSNTFGEDVYSTSTSGTVTTPRTWTGSLTAFFLVANPSNAGVICTVVGSNEIVSPDSIELIKISDPAAGDVASFTEDNDTGNQKSDAVVDEKGVLIKVKTSRVTTCKW